MRCILSILVENEPGALSRIVGLFAQRGYNIESLNVAPTLDGSLSRMTLTTHAEGQIIEQITKQLHKLIDVVKVIELNEASHVERELMLVKVRAVAHQRAEVMRTVDIFRAQVVDVTPTAYVIQLVGDSHKLDAFIHALDEGSVIELTRSGVLGLSRGEKHLSV